MTEGSVPPPIALDAAPFADAGDISEYVGLSVQRVHQLLDKGLADGSDLTLPADLATVRLIDAAKRYEAAAMSLVEAIGCAVALTPRGRFVAASNSAQSLLFRSLDELRGVDARLLGFTESAIRGDSAEQGSVCELRRGRWRTQRSIAVRFKRGADIDLAKRQRASLGLARRTIVEGFLEQLGAAEEGKSWTTVLRSEQFDDLWEPLVVVRVWGSNVELTPHSQSTPTLRVVRIVAPSLLQTIHEAAAAVTVPEPGVVEQVSVYARFAALAESYAARLAAQFCAESCSIFLQDRAAGDADPEYGARSSTPGELTLRPASVSGLPREFLTRETFAVPVALPFEADSEPPVSGSDRPRRDPIILSALRSAEPMAFRFEERPARAPNMETFATNSRLDRAEQCALLPIRNGRNDTPHTVGVVRVLHFVKPPGSSPQPTDIEPRTKNPPAANQDWLAELAQIGHAMYVLYRRLVASGWRALVRDTISDLALLADATAHKPSFDEFVRRLMSRIALHVGLDFQQVVLWRRIEHELRVFDMARRELIPQQNPRVLKVGTFEAEIERRSVEIEVPLETYELCFEIGGVSDKVVAVRNGLELGVASFGVLGCYNSLVLTRNQSDAIRRGLVRNCKTLAHVLSLAARVDGISRPK